MRKKKIISTLIAAAMGVCVQAQSEKALPKVPHVDIRTVEGSTVNTSSFSNGGKPYVISFWATWCKPCVNELNAIADNYTDWKTETGFKLIAVSIDDSRNMSKIGPFANGKNWDYEIFADPNGDFKRALNVNNIPHTFLVNGKGEIIWQHNSYTPGDEEKLHELLIKASKGEEIKE